MQFRLLLAGLYPVEFRDFFLGDMYCSQTYSMGVSFAYLLMKGPGLTLAIECGAFLLPLRKGLE